MWVVPSEKGGSNTGGNCGQIHAKFLFLTTWSLLLENSSSFYVAENILINFLGELGNSDT